MKKRTISTEVRCLITAGLVLGVAVVAGSLRISRADPAGVVYVDAGAPGPADGLSWTTAFTEVQSALAVAVPGDEIWVAEGVYTPDYDPGSGQYTGHVTATFVLTNDVALYGGFGGYGISEPLRTQRDWAAHPTVLSGDIDRDDITDSRGVVVSTYDLAGTNGWTVVSSSGVTQTAVLDGFFITAGTANGSDADCEAWQPCCSGGGMHNEEGSPTVRHVTFSANTAQCCGGGMYNHHGDPTLTDVIFSGNSANRYGGGGMYNYYSSPTLTDATFSGNKVASRGGGGMLNDHSSPTLTDVTFIGNLTVNWGGGMLNDYSSPALTDVTFSHHSARHGGGMYNANGSSPIMLRVAFSRNTALLGGGMYNSASSPTLEGVTFNGNCAYGVWGLPEGGACGGGMYNDYSNPTVTNAIFSGNYTYISGEYPPPELGGAGAGMFNDYSKPTLTNVTFSGNSNGTIDDNSGGGIRNYQSSPTLTNCILWGNAPNQIANYSSSVSASFSDIQGGYSGTGNIDADPLFVRAPDPGDGDWLTPGDNDYGDLHLQQDSPAIDAGDNAAVPGGVTIDLAGDPRFFDMPGVADTGSGTPPIVDMGAYEARLPARVHMPLVMRGYVFAPDLVVQRIVVTPGQVQVVIANMGNAPVPDDFDHEFWVDLYVNPTHEPVYNEIWPMVAEHGAVWGITWSGSPHSPPDPAQQALPLEPGEAITLTAGGDYYWPVYSDVRWPLAAGTVIYTQVDSASAGTTYGAVLEGDEGNNVGGPLSLAGASWHRSFLPADGGAVAGDVRQTELPVRPEGLNRGSRDLVDSATHTSR